MYIGSFKIYIGHPKRRTLLLFLPVKGQCPVYADAGGGGGLKFVTFFGRPLWIPTEVYREIKIQKEIILM